MVGDVGANVKTYQDASDAVPFAEADPDTHFYLPEDAANQVAMDNITYLPGFSADGMRSTLNESLEAGANLAEGGFVDDALFCGVPVVLLFSTASRQLAAIKEGKRIQDAVLDGTLTVGVKAIGAVAGGQAGALVGAQIDVLAGSTTFGAGAAVGTIAGAVAGSKFGGKMLRQYRELEFLSAEKDLKQALKCHGKRLHEAGAGEVLRKAIDAPTDRAEKAQAELAGHVKRDRRSLQWRLWPGADQVLRETALVHADEDVRALQVQRVSDRAQWQPVWNGEKPKHLALVCLNVPTLAAGLDVTTKEVRKAKKRVTAKRAALAGK